MTINFLTNSRQKSARRVSVAVRKDPRRERYSVDITIGYQVMADLGWTAKDRARAGWGEEDDLGLMIVQKGTAKGAVALHWKKPGKGSPTLKAGCPDWVRQATGATTCEWERSSRIKDAIELKLPASFAEQYTSFQRAREPIGQSAALAPDQPSVLVPARRDGEPSEEAGRDRPASEDGNALPVRETAFANGDVREPGPGGGVQESHTVARGTGSDFFDPIDPAFAIGADDLIEVLKEVRDRFDIDFVHQLLGLHDCDVEFFCHIPAAARAGILESARSVLAGTEMVRPGLKNDDPDPAARKESLRTDGAEHPGRANDEAAKPLGPAASPAAGVDRTIPDTPEREGHVAQPGADTVDAPETNQSEVAPPLDRAEAGRGESSDLDRDGGAPPLAAASESETRPAEIHGEGASGTAREAPSTVSGRQELAPDRRDEVRAPAKAEREAGESAPASKAAAPTVGDLADAVSRFTGHTSKLRAIVRRHGADSALGVPEANRAALIAEILAACGTEKEKPETAPASSPIAARSTIAAAIDDGRNSVDRAATILASRHHVILPGENSMVRVDGRPHSYAELCRRAGIEYREGDKYLGGVAVVCDAAQAIKIIRATGKSVKKTGLYTYDVDGVTTPLSKLLAMATDIRASGESNAELADRIPKFASPVDVAPCDTIEEAVDYCTGVMKDRLKQIKGGFILNGGPKLSNGGVIDRANKHIASRARVAVAAE